MEALHRSKVKCAQTPAHSAGCPLPRVGDICEASLIGRQQRIADSDGRWNIGSPEAPTSNDVARCLGYASWFRTRSPQLLRVV
jgi:hypothetical protein